MIDFKRFLKFLSPKDQLHEINFMIDYFNKSNRAGENIAKKYSILKELRTLEKNV